MKAGVLRLREGYEITDPESASFQGILTGYKPEKRESTKECYILLQGMGGSC